MSENIKDALETQVNGWKTQFENYANLSNVEFYNKYVGNAKTLYEDLGYGEDDEFDEDFLPNIVESKINEAINNEMLSVLSIERVTNNNTGKDEVEVLLTTGGPGITLTIILDEDKAFISGYWGSEEYVVNVSDYYTELESLYVI